MSPLPVAATLLALTIAILVRVRAARRKKPRSKAGTSRTAWRAGVACGTVMTFLLAQPWMASEQVTVASSDEPIVGYVIGEQAGVDDARGGVKPDGKSSGVNELKDAGYAVGMIGDGINDAPALAAADVGIAMGTGTDIAMETAGVTLMRPDPRLVAASISVSRATFSKIKQNLFWAFIYNIIGIPLAAMGLLTPTIAGAAMALSSVSVVSNSLLLRRWKPDFSKKD